MNKPEPKKKLAGFAALAVLSLVALPLASAQNLDPSFLPTGPLPPEVFPEIPQQVALMIVIPDSEVTQMVKPVAPAADFELIAMVGSGQTVSQADLVVTNILDGSQQTIPGIISVDDDPNSTSMSGDMEVSFPSVPASLHLEYQLDVDSGAFVQEIDPFTRSESRCQAITDGPETCLMDPQPQNHNRPCRTVASSTGVTQSDVPTYQRTVSLENKWVTYARLNFRSGVTYSAMDCNTNQPMSGAPTGYAVTVEGPNNPAVDGKYLMTFAIAYAGDEGEGTNGFGWHSIKSRPLIALFKPPESDDGDINLVKADLLGYNKKSCTDWPPLLEDALAVIPKDYFWSAVAHFATRDYCTTKWTELKGGSPGDRDYVGVYVKKATTGQKEVGGEISFRAADTGRYEMPFIFYDHIYGNVRAHGAGTTESISDWVGGSLRPVARVV